MKTPTLSPETERELLDELTDVFENNDDGGHYEYRSFVPRDLESIKQLIAKVEQRAIEAERNRILTLIDDSHIEKTNRNVGVYDMEIDNYNQALDDLVVELTEKKL